MDSVVSTTISVVIPVFNRADELRRALDSLLVQSYKTFEVVVCDDGSTEDIASVVASFEDRLSVRYLRIANSGGPARPRNTAILAAQGEWIALLDSDDWWDANRMELVVRELSDRVDLVYHPQRAVRAKGVVNSPERRPIIGSAVNGDPLRHMALWGNPIPNSAVVVRKSALMAIGGFSEDRALVAVEDFDAWIRLAKSGARMRFLSQVLGSYWIGQDGISGFSSKQIERLETLFTLRQADFDPAYLDLARACQSYRVGVMQLQLGQNLVAAHRSLLQAKPLPTFAMRVKRVVKLLQVQFRRR